MIVPTRTAAPKPMSQNETRRMTWRRAFGEGRSSLFTGRAPSGREGVCILSRRPPGSGVADLKVNPEKCVCLERAPRPAVDDARSGVKSRHAHHKRGLTPCFQITAQRSAGVPQPRVVLRLPSRCDLEQFYLTLRGSALQLLRHCLPAEELSVDGCSPTLPSPPRQPSFLRQSLLLGVPLLRLQQPLW